MPALGACLFAVSGWVLGHRRFVGPLPGGRVAVHVPYHVGQALLIVALATASRRPPLACPTVNGQWVFGYGSLVSPVSFGLTVGRDPRPGVDFFEAEIVGYGRRWNYGTGFTFSAWQRDVEPDPVVWTAIALGVVASAPETTNGVVCWVDDDELEQLDRRERRYDRVDVSAATTVHAEIDGAYPIVTYTPRRKAIETYEAARARGTAAITQRYWDLVDGAFAALGEDRRERYHATTPRPEIPIVAIPVEQAPDHHRAERR